MVFIVAEIGVNWQGDIKVAKEMILAAKNAGVDAVKFQAFLYKHVKEHPLSSKLMQCSMEPFVAGYLKDHAQSMGIEWFCTPFYPEAVLWLEDLGVKRYKIRELDSRPLLKEPAEITPLVQAVLDTRKEVIISAQRKPIHDLFLFYHPQIRWIYCRPEYPPKLQDIPFWLVKAFAGYSNHYPDIVTPLTATVMGAQIIEVHVKPDIHPRNWLIDKIATWRDSASFPIFDQAVSLSFAELGLLVKKIRQVEKMQFEAVRG